MKYIKISLIIIIITSFIYYKFNKDEDILFEDKLSMFILVKEHDNIEDILFDLSSQIESFDEYIFNVYYSKNNDFLIRNKFELQFDQDYIDYKSLFGSSNLTNFNNRLGDMIEKYFLDSPPYLFLGKEYLLRDFLIRFNNYFQYQKSSFNKQIAFADSKEEALKDFILGPKYISDYKKQYYLMRVEFLNLESIAKYEQSGLDSVFKSILNYNSETFSSELFFYYPYSSDSIGLDLDFKMKQYIKEFPSIEEAIDCHKNLMLSENVLFVESIYDYYFTDENNLLDDEILESLKLNTTILDSNYYINENNYKSSLLYIEEKLITLQNNNLFNDPVIRSILYDLVGDGYKKGDYSQYIDSITPDSSYLINNLNRLFSYGLEDLFNNINQAKKEFDVSLLPLEVKKHLCPNKNFKVRYFIE